MTNKCLTTSNPIILSLVLILTVMFLDSCCPEYEPAFERFELCSLDFREYANSPRCSSDHEEFSTSDDFISASASVFGVSIRNENITFRLYQITGSTIELIDEVSGVLMDLGKGTGTETCEFVAGYSWIKGDADWNVGIYQIELEIDISPPLVISKDFSITE